MLNVLRQKCEPFLREDTEGPGVIAIKQDVGSLYGLDDGFFDYVVLNNVLYSLEPEAAKACLKEAHRVLKPGGELRFSEPKKGNKLSKVLDQIGRDLKSNNRYTGLERNTTRSDRSTSSRSRPCCTDGAWKKSRKRCAETSDSRRSRTPRTIYTRANRCWCVRKNRNFSGHALILLRARARRNRTRSRLI